VGVEKNASILANAPCHTVDVGMCNQYSFMMWAGIGLDALTIHSIEPRFRLEKFFAMPEYTAKTIWQAAQWNGVKLRMWVDGEEVEGNYIVAVSTNIRHYLGGYSNLSPNAYLDDGCSTSGCSAGTIWGMRCVMPIICGADTT
jgi:diacylglycerol kinase family enzyme